MRNSGQKHHKAKSISCFRTASAFLSGNTQKSVGAQAYGSSNASHFGFERALVVLKEPGGFLLP
jgi:hypothetical protein